MTVANKWVIPPPKKTLVVGMADMVASNDFSADLVTYSLGSCLGISIYDPAKKIGGLLHVMLPDSSIDSTKAQTQPYMFVDTGLPLLFRAVSNLGADRNRLVIRIAGGAQLLDPQRVFNIGERNCARVTEMLARNGYAVKKQDTGGVASRTMRLDLANGDVSIKSPGRDLYYL